MAKDYISVEQKRRINLRAHNRCEYCKSARDYACHTFHIEHIIPLCAGGTTSMNNLALACAGCNGSKSIKVQAIDLLTKNTVRLFHPRQQAWDDHFIWNENLLEVLGITPTGRATVDALKLNRVEVINLRKIMSLAGLHPP